MKGPENEIFIESHRHAYQNLTRLNPGQWTLSTEMADASIVILPTTCKGIAIELLRAVPMVTEVDDIDDFLKWREERSPERRRFVDSMNSLAVEIQYSENPLATLHSRLRAIEVVCNDLQKVTEEKGYGFTLGDISLNFNPENLSRDNFLSSGAKWATPFGLLSRPKRLPNNPSHSVSARYPVHRHHYFRCRIQFRLSARSQTVARTTARTRDMLAPSGQWKRWVCAGSCRHPTLWFVK